MAVLTIIGRPIGRETGQLNDLLGGDFVDDYLIRTDDPLVDRLVVLQMADLPDLWDRYSNIANTLAYYYVVKDIDCKTSAESPWLRIVTVRYSTSATEERRQTLDPNDHPPIYKKKSQRATRACEYDDPGKPVVNSASLPFDPPYEREENNVLLIVTRNEPAFDLARDQQYEDSVNSLPWRNGLPGTWKCLSIDGDEGYERNTYIVQHAYQFLYKRSGWTGYHIQPGRVIHPDKTRILDVGKAERVNGQVQIIYDTRLHPIPNPVCMDGRGLRLDPGPDRGTKLTAVLLASQTTAKVETAALIVQGQLAQIEQEIVIVDKVDVVANTLKLVRGQNGTAAADHAPLGPLPNSFKQKSGTSTVLVDPLLAGGVTVVVEDALKFGFVSRAPGGGITFPAYDIVPFIRIEREEMYVTDAVKVAFVGWVLTVVRGVNGSAAVAHLAGVEVRQAPTYINFNMLGFNDFNALGF